MSRMRVKASNLDRFAPVQMLARKDVIAGLLFSAVAVVGLYISRDYPVGSALRMGTGYVPRLLCWILLALGAVVLVQGLRKGDARPRQVSATPSSWRSVVFVPAKSRHLWACARAAWPRFVDISADRRRVASSARFAPA